MLKIFEDIKDIVSDIPSMIDKYLSEALKSMDQQKEEWLIKAFGSLEYAQRMAEYYEIEEWSPYIVPDGRGGFTIRQDVRLRHRQKMLAELSGLDNGE